MIKLYIVLICIFLYKLISSLIDFININRYYSMYEKYILKGEDNIFHYKSAVISLMKKASIKDIEVPVSQKTGYGMIANFKASLFQNFPDNTNLFFEETYRILQDAKGIYKRKFFETFSPKYWIDCIIFLPKNILSYLNISPESIFTKIFQIVYWILCFIWAIFQTEIINFIKSFFTR